MIVQIVIIPNGCEKSKRMIKYEANIETKSNNKDDIKNSNKENSILYGNRSANFSAHS